MRDFARETTPAIRPVQFVLAPAREQIVQRFMDGHLGITVIFILTTLTTFPANFSNSRPVILSLSWCMTSNVLSQLLTWSFF